MKKLITVDNLGEFVSPSSTKVVIDPASMLLTPGARDELAKRKIAVEYGHAQASNSCPPGCTCPACLDAILSNPDLENMLIGVAALLKKEYGVTDPGELRALSLKALQTIKDNI